jgi:hypothetical protein
MSPTLPQLGRISTAISPIAHGAGWLPISALKVGDGEVSGSGVAHKNGTAEDANRQGSAAEQMRGDSKNAPNRPKAFEACGRKLWPRGRGA